MPSASIKSQVIAAIVLLGLTFLAALLMVPYLAWVSFATLLTITIWQMNPELL